MKRKSKGITVSAANIDDIIRGVKREIRNAKHQSSDFWSYCELHQDVHALSVAHVGCFPGTVFEIKHPKV